MKYFTAVLTVFLCLAVTVPSFADTLNDAQKKKSDLESEKKSTESMLKDLNSLKSDVNKYVQQLDADLAGLEMEITGLDGELKKLDSEIEKTEEKIKKTETEIADAEKQLKEAEKTTVSQFDNMKLRIKYMYERSDTTLLDILFTSKGLLQFLNRGEYIEKISDYDRRQLDAYEDSCANVAEKKEMLELRKSELEGERSELEGKKAKQLTIKAETEEKKQGVEALIGDKKTEIEAYENKIGTAEEQLKKYEEEIARQESTIKAIEAEIKRREEEERKAAEAAGQAYKTVSLGDISFIWPCPSSSRITSYFGDRDAPVAGASTNHKGIDIAASTGSGILAAADGEVTISTYSPSSGNYIMINHGGGIYTVYMHASELYVSEGEKVTQGQKIAAVGSTGYSTGPHLHFGIRANGSYVNPIAYVSP